MADKKEAQIIIVHPNAYPERGINNITFINGCALKPFSIAHIVDC
jgi:hypothetical protein